ncbi:unnamed protein product [Calicophoron daubneyi]|uniref:Uncharacterized protein n=1 Tax=Calicophoron daubneyi TaxID=300641 RepID=A0AAV2TVA4_CALDB
MGEFIGKWKLVDHKGLDIVLKALSVSEEELKNLIKHATLECSQPKNEHLRLNTNLPFFPGNAEFRIGEEFEQMWADQSTVKMGFEYVLQLENKLACTTNPETNPINRSLHPSFL